MPSCPLCRSTGDLARTCLGDQKCVVCLNICTRFAVLECGHLICVDCAGKMGYNIIGSMKKPSWEFGRSYDDITGKVTHIRDPDNGKRYVIRGINGRNLLALERKARLR